MLHGLSAIFLYSALSISFVFEGGSTEKMGTGFFIKNESNSFFVTNRHVISCGEKLGKIQRIIIEGKSGSGEPQYKDDFVFDAHEWNVEFPENNDDDIAVLYGVSGRQEGQPVLIDREMLVTESYFEDEGNLGVYD